MMNKLNKKLLEIKNNNEGRNKDLYYLGRESYTPFGYIGLLFFFIGKKFVDFSDFLNVWSKERKFKKEFQFYKTNALALEKLEIDETFNIVHLISPSKLDFWQTKYLHNIKIINLVGRVYNIRPSDKEVSDEFRTYFFTTPRADNSNGSCPTSHYNFRFFAKDYGKTWFCFSSVEKIFSADDCYKARKQWWTLREEEQIEILDNTD